MLQAGMRCHTWLQVDAGGELGLVPTSCSSKAQLPTRCFPAVQQLSWTCPPMALDSSFQVTRLRSRSPFQVCSPEPPDRTDQAGAPRWATTPGSRNAASQSLCSAGARTDRSVQAQQIQGLDHDLTRLDLALVQPCSI